MPSITDPRLNGYSHTLVSPLDPDDPLVAPGRPHGRHTPASAAPCPLGAHRRRCSSGPPAWRDVGADQDFLVTGTDYLPIHLIIDGQCACLDAKTWAPHGQCAHVLAVEIWKTASHTLRGEV
jgi:hypothetical protein